MTTRSHSRFELRAIACMVAWVCTLCIVFAVGTPNVQAKPHGGGHTSAPHSATTSHPGKTTGSTHTEKPSSPKAVPGLARDSHGKIARSHKATTDFKRSHPCPVTHKSTGNCPGYVIDHVVPLKRGGADAPSNMQWQTTRDAKQKDKTE